MSNTTPTIETVLELMQEVRQEQRESRASVEQRIDSLEANADERSRETRPMWEQALAEILAVRGEMREFREYTERRFDAVDERLDRIDGYHAVLADRDLSKDVDIAKLKRRIDRIESDATNAPTGVVK